MDIVIIGGGIAAAHAARELREHGHEGGIVVLAAERHLPYERPPLSKGILLGDATPESAHVMEQHWYDDNDVDLRTGTEVTPSTSTAARSTPAPSRRRTTGC